MESFRFLINYIIRPRDSVVNIVYLYLLVQIYFSQIIRLKEIN